MKEEISLATSFKKGLTKEERADFILGVEKGLGVPVSAEKRPVKPEEEIPTGRKEYEKGFDRVVSTHSFAYNWIPKGAKKFRDWVTGLVEEIL